MSTVRGICISYVDGLEEFNLTWLCQPSSKLRRRWLSEKRAATVAMPSRPPGQLGSQAIFSSAVNTRSIHVNEATCHNLSAFKGTISTEQHVDARRCESRYVFYWQWLSFTKLTVFHSQRAYERVSEAR